MQDGVVESTPTPDPLQFSITHDGTIDESLTGRLYVMLTKGRIPRLSGPDWYNPEPFFAIDVVDWKPNTPMLLGENADAMDGPPSSIGEGPWKAIALLRKDNDYSILSYSGGIHSEAVIIEGSGATSGSVAMTLTTLIADRTWKPHKNVRMVEVRSEMLSKFYGRDVEHGAVVIVPDDYDPNREEPYPVMYWIGGFGSDHYGARYMKSLFTASDYDDQICRVVLNAQSYGGHHVFADSENNGPRMTALLSELIPLVEKKYNLGGSSELRFLAGHSSGGWSALWLLVNNPDFFSGAWSFAPDPIDFHHFQTVDLYAEGANMYVDEDGQERPLARNGITPVIFSRGFIAMDDVIKDGGQIGSFEWVFSPQGEDGRPVQMFDRETGEVNQEVVQHWKKYDILHLLTSNWDELAPKLAGKITIVAGDIDTFYLEGAVFAMMDFLEGKEFDARIEMHEGWDHGDVFRTTTLREMDEWYAQQLGLINKKAPAKALAPQ